ncbi:hypothetical protein QYF36_026911 [Acer negundo]|nr:hypothetical protein QYF36_026911 [Acer negundo]
MPTNQTGYVVSSSHVADAVLIEQPSSTLPQGIILPLPNSTRPEIARSVTFVPSLVHQSPFEKVQQQDSSVPINQAFTTIIQPILDPKGFSSSEPSNSTVIGNTILPIDQMKIIAMKSWEDLAENEEQWQTVQQKSKKGKNSADQLEFVQRRQRRPPLRLDLWNELRDIYLIAPSSWMVDRTNSIPDFSFQFPFF